MMTVVWIVLGAALVLASMLGIAAWVYRELVPPADTVPDDISALLPDQVDAAWRDSLPDVRRSLFEPVTPVDRTASITCPRCAMTSYNPNDIAAGYCGHCHDYTGSLLTEDTPPTFRRPTLPPHLNHGTPRYPKDPKDHDY